MRPNFFKETIEVLEKNGKTKSDVLWVGDSDFCFNWDRFEGLAKDLRYDNSFGSQYIDDLFIVGKDWWLERHEYDGSEWWEYKKIPIKPKKNNNIKLVKGQWAIYFKEVK